MCSGFLIARPHRGGLLLRAGRVRVRDAVGAAPLFPGEHAHHGLGHVSVAVVRLRGNAVTGEVAEPDPVTGSGQRLDEPALVGSSFRSSVSER